jgi:hypothetical protein
VVKAFESVVFGSGRLSGLERETVLKIPTQMALKSADSENAFRFLTKGTEPAFWEETFKWQDAENGGDNVRLLVSGCIRALGRTGRPEAQRFLLELGSTPLGERFAGSILAGICAYDLVQEMGFIQFHAKILPPEAFSDMYFQWQNTPKAAKHVEWYNNVKEKNK